MSNATLLKVEIDGRQVEVPHGTTVLEAANKLGIYVPHFCYHKKLSIAANCRMCLVQVEKAPKPLPACATPATDGMKAFTHSDAAKAAQEGVMEFLLINHPLDCPICDQGGECQLQDLAVGYGMSSSRYDEPKRVVLNKNLGPLIATDMTRCIHCTRCVRFGQEVAGVMELGMANRGEHAEIMTFVGKTVDSEVSGNMIDLCPVGALTSKPFRYQARPWELARRKSISPHDGLGSNLILQVKLNRVMRALPLENEEINECWLSDRDRFSYEGLDSPDRLLKPMIKEGGRWSECDWRVALERVVAGLKQVTAQGGDALDTLGALASPHSTLEEMYLLQKLARALGSENVDFRLRQSDFRSDANRQGAPWLGMKLTELGQLDRVLIVGSFLRKDHPLLINRFRQAVKRGQQVNLIHVADDPLLMSVKNKAVVAPSELPRLLAQVLRAAGEAKEAAVPNNLADMQGTQPSDVAKAIASSLVSGKKVGIFLGNSAEHHPQAADLQALALQLAELLGGKLGFLGEAANSVGGYKAQCTPGAGGRNAATMFGKPCKAYVLLGLEAELDTANPRAALSALQGAELVVALSAFKGRLPDYAHVLLPIAPFSETGGSFVNTEGRLQSFNAVAKPAGDARPAWKVLRMLATMLNLSGFDYDTSESVRRDVLRTDADVPGLAARLDNSLDGYELAQSALSDQSPAGLQRIADVPIYFSDALVRRAEPLQKTRDARAPRAIVHSDTAAKLGLSAGSAVRARQDGGEAVLELAIDDSLPADCVRIAAAHPSTAGLGLMFGAISLESA